MFFVYIIWSDTLQSFYVGSTQDIENRLIEHNIGEGKSTKKGAPWKLVHAEEFETRAEAIRKERQIKGRGIKRYLDDVRESG